MHIGLLRRSALGDVILWSALVEQCLRRYPEVEITWMIDPNFIPLFNAPMRVQWCPVPKPKTWRSYRTAIKQLRQYRFDLLFCAQASLRSNVLYPFCPAKRKIGFDKQRGRDGHGFFIDERIPYRDNHLIEGFAQFFEQAGYPLDLTDLRWPISPTKPNTKAHQLFPTNEPQEPQEPQQEPQIGIVVAASKLERSWPVKHQITFIESLLSHTSAHIHLIGGPSETEHDFATRISAATLDSHETRIHNHVGQTTLTSLPNLLNQMDCVITPDTGPAHLARAIDVPVIGLYAVARASLTGPYGSTTTIDAYHAAAQKLLNTSAAHLAWHDRIHHPDAMTLIDPALVLTKTLELLASRSPKGISASKPDLL